MYFITVGSTFTSSTYPPRRPHLVWESESQLSLPRLWINILIRLVYLPLNFYSSPWKLTLQRSHWILSERKPAPPCLNKDAPSRTEPSCRRQTRSFPQKHTLDRPWEFTKCREYKCYYPHLWIIRGSLIEGNAFRHPPHQPAGRASSLRQIGSPPVWIFGFEPDLKVWNQPCAVWKNI